MNPKHIKKLILVILLIGIAGFQYFQKPDTSHPPANNTQNTHSSSLVAIHKAINEGDTHASFWVTLDATVIKTLKDDNKGSRHQRFLIKPDNKITLLVAHNIDLAKHVPIKKGDRITLRGRYEWNNKGGVVHWTHHDPRGKKTGGWIKFAGVTYQ
jgi:hypothetical protein